MRNNGWILVLLLILVALFGGQVFAKKGPQKSRVQQLIYSNSKNQLSEVTHEEGAVRDPAAHILPGRLD